jgi:hypothetical protein
MSTDSNYMLAFIILQKMLMVSKIWNFQVEVSLYMKPKVSELRNISYTTFPELSLDFVQTDASPKFKVALHVSQDQYLYIFDRIKIKIFPKLLEWNTGQIGNENIYRDFLRCAWYNVQAEMSKTKKISDYSQVIMCFFTQETTELQIKEL